MRKLLIKYKDSRRSDKTIEVKDENAPSFMTKECRMISCGDCEFCPCGEESDFWDSIGSVTEIKEEDVILPKSRKIPLKPLEITLQRDYKKGETLEIVDGEIVEKPKWTIQKILGCDDIKWGCFLKQGNIEHVVTAKTKATFETIGQEEDEVVVWGPTNRQAYIDFKFFKRNGEEILPPRDTE